MVRRWAAAFNSGDPRKVLALYRKDGVLIPTLEAKILIGRDGMLPYFVDLLVTKGAKVVVNDYLSRGKVESGFYTFYLADGTQLGARFTFVPQGGKIQTHHSSAIP
jgi:hypothetical protein